MNTIGTRLKAIRLQKKLTQPELAEQIGVAKSMISQWETQKNEPKACYIYSLANCLNVSTDYLLGMENEDFTSNYNSDKVLTADEERLLQEYRKLDNPMKKMCYYYVEHMVTATTEDKENKNHG